MVTLASIGLTFWVKANQSGRLGAPTPRSRHGGCDFQDVGARVGVKRQPMALVVILTRQLAKKAGRNKAQNFTARRTCWGCNPAATHFPINFENSL